MAAKKEVSIESKLRRLYELQLIDSEKDEIEVLKGELPIEVSDLEDEIAGLDKRIAKSNEQIEEVEQEIARHRTNLKESESAIEKYNKQLEDVKNNREYGALVKEIEFHKLEIQLSEKKITAAQGRIHIKKETLEGAVDKQKTTVANLEIKKKELKEIIAETEKQEKKLEKESVSARKKIEDRLLFSYDKIRKAYRNNLAVVTVSREACGGCFNRIPPQLQIDIGLRKKINACEHCGRILVDDQILVTSNEPA